MMRVIPFVLCILALTASSAFAQSNPAPAYLIAEFEVIDADGMQKFGEATAPIVKAHGGQFLARRGKIMPAVGDPPKNVTIVAFPSVEKAQAYLQSPEYKALIPNRDKSAKWHTYIVEGTGSP